MAALAPGDRVGHYEIAAVVDSGGMGEVYRAVDVRLQRNVAIKALPSASAMDADAIDALDREARAISSLNHPHICTLHDLVEHEDRHFLVMEYIAGETLATRLLRGRMAVTEVLRTAIEIADALHHAHGKGIVHGDVKPSNVVLGETGAKLLDFGIARAAERGPLVPSAAATVRRDTGGLNGTVRYMAPERLHGQSADSRSDVFSLGAVIYEMACGRAAFDGPDFAHTVAAMVATAPLRFADAEPALLDLEPLVAKCLAPAPEHRWQSCGDLAEVLRWLDGKRQPTDVKPVPDSRGVRGGLRWWAAAFAATAIAATVWFALGSRPAAVEPKPADRVTFGINIGEGMHLSAVSHPIALSPDGRRLVFVATARGGPKVLWIRRFDALHATPLAQTDGAEGPFWSPDGTRIAFFADGFLKTIGVDGSDVRVVCRTPGSMPGTWNRDGVLIFPRASSGALERVPASGGTPTAVTALDAAHQDIGHIWPQFLPDGKTFLYLVRSPDPERRGIYLGTLDGAPSQRVLASDTQALYAESGHLLTARNGELVAIPFDAGTRRVLGDAVPLGVNVTQTRYGFFHGRLAIALGADTLVYLAPDARELIAVDRTGREVARVGERGPYENVEISPDGRWAALGRFSTDGSEDVSIVDLQGGASRQLTTPVSPGARPIWSPDSEKVVLVSARRGKFVLYERPRNGGGERLRLELPLTSSLGPTNWPGPALVLFERTGTPTRKDIWALPLDGATAPFLVVQTNGDDLAGRLSPDGKWIAYGSNETGAYEVFLQRFPTGEGRTKVSADGGIEPRWGRAGELLYIDPTGTIISAAVPRGVVEARTPLFASRLQGVLEFASGNSQYGVTTDANRLLLSVPVEDPGRLYVQMNWAATIGRGARSD